MCSTNNKGLSMKPYRIDDEISVDYTDSSQTVRIYDNRDSSPPQIITVLTAEQVWAITGWWLDGYCLCGNPIPQDDVVCNNCFGMAAAKRDLRSRP